MTDESHVEPRAVDVEIFRRKLTVSMEELSPDEILKLADEVNDRMTRVAEENPKIADSSKIALLAALDFASEMHRLRRRLSGASGIIRATAHAPELEEIVLWLETTRGMVDRLLALAKECPRPGERRKPKRIRR